MSFKHSYCLVKFCYLSQHFNRRVQDLARTLLDRPLDRSICCARFLFLTKKQAKYWRSPTTFSLVYVHGVFSKNNIYTPKTAISYGKKGNNTCNLFCNIAARRVKKRCCPFYLPRSNLSCNKSGCCNLLDMNTDFWLDN